MSIGFTKKRKMSSFFIIAHFGKNCKQGEKKQRGKGVQSVKECRMQSAEHVGVQSAENAECGVQS